MEEITTDSKAFKLDNLKEDRSYAMQIRSYNEDSYSEWSPIYRFKTNNYLEITNYDYFLIEYYFSDGSDLDTRTGILDPNDYSYYVGWAQQSNIPITGNTILSWGGDNTGRGVESILLNMVNFKNQFPNNNYIKLDLRTQWYGSVGTNAIVIRGYAFKGGSMFKSGYYTWDNTTYTDKKVFPEFSKSSSFFSRSGASIGERLITLEINFLYGTFTYV